MNFLHACHPVMEQVIYDVKDQFFFLFGLPPISLDDISRNTRRRDREQTSLLLIAL